MGILNITPDSFSDGGKFNSQEIAIEQAYQMAQQGAQIIDIGGESTRPGSESISSGEETERVLPIVESLAKDQFIISIDTTKPIVAEYALQAGAHLINDVSGGNEKLLSLAQKYSAGFIAMHSQGIPKSMQKQPSYMNVTNEIKRFFLEKKAFLKSFELPRIWIDPGIGFGKSLQHNIELMRNLDQFSDETWGTLIGTSRKSWIDHLCNANDPLDRLGGSIASALDAASKGVEIIRVHDVKETSQALQVGKKLA
jgi:dihydropteroate synthase